MPPGVDVETGERTALLAPNAPRPTRRVSKLRWGLAAAVSLLFLIADYQSYSPLNTGRGEFQATAKSERTVLANVKVSAAATNADTPCRKALGELCGATRSAGAACYNCTRSYANLSTTAFSSSLFCETWDIDAFCTSEGMVVMSAQAPGLVPVQLEESSEPQTTAEFVLNSFAVCRQYEFGIGPAYILLLRAGFTAMFLAWLSVLPPPVGSGEPSVPGPLAVVVGVLLVAKSLWASFEILFVTPVPAFAKGQWYSEYQLRWWAALQHPAFGQACSVVLHKLFGWIATELAWRRKAMEYRRGGVAKRQWDASAVPESAKWEKGATVTIRSDKAQVTLAFEKTPEVDFDDDMHDLLGKTGVIVQVDEDDDTLEVEIDGESNWWPFDAVVPGDGTQAAKEAPGPAAPSAAAAAPPPREAPAAKSLVDEEQSPRTKRQAQVKRAESMRPTQPPGYGPVQLLFDVAEALKPPPSAALSKWGTWALQISLFLATANMLIIAVPLSITHLIPFALVLVPIVLIGVFHLAWWRVTLLQTIDCILAGACIALAGGIVAWLKQTTERVCSKKEEKPDWAPANEHNAVSTFFGLDGLRPDHPRMFASRAVFVKGLSLVAAFLVLVMQQAATQVILFNERGPAQFYTAVIAMLVAWAVCFKTERDDSDAQLPRMAGRALLVAASVASAHFIAPLELSTAEVFDSRQTCAYVECSLHDFDQGIVATINSYIELIPFATELVHRISPVECYYTVEYKPPNWHVVGIVLVSLIVFAALGYVMTRLRAKFCPPKENNDVLDLLAGDFNHDGVKVTLSTRAGHRSDRKLHYCGRHVRTCGGYPICPDGRRQDRCPTGCDGRCGPTNGCQCKACFRLDMQLSLNSGGDPICPDGHKMFPLLVDEPLLKRVQGVYCNVCRTRVAPGAVILRCRRCPDCFDWCQCGADAGVGFSPDDKEAFPSRR